MRILPHEGVGRERILEPHRQGDALLVEGLPIGAAEDAVYQNADVGPPLRDEVADREPVEYPGGRIGHDENRARVAV